MHSHVKGAWMLVVSRSPYVLERERLKFKFSDEHSRPSHMGHPCGSKLHKYKQTDKHKNSQEKWVRDCKLYAVEDLNWTFVYSLPRICTVSTKLRNFQFKFLHLRIATNSFLFKIRISDTALFYLCKTDEEILIHLYWECSETKALAQQCQPNGNCIHLAGAFV